MSYLYSVQDQTKNIAEVLNPAGQPIYHIYGRDLIDHRIMASERDLLGLARYLAKLKVIPWAETILPA